MSLLPVRCFTCCKVIGNYQVRYDNLITYITELINTNDANIKLGEELIDKFFVDNKNNRYCCRQMFLGYKNIDDKLLKYKSNN